MKLLWFLLVHQASAIIHHLNFTEYSKMPELYAMDDYDLCVAEPGGTYCVIDADLSSKEDSELMQMILEYSDSHVKHYNHTKVHRAWCVTTTCKGFMQNKSLESEADLRSVLGECVEDGIWKEYKLNAKKSICARFFLAQKLCQADSALWWGTRSKTQKAKGLQWVESYEDPGAYILFNGLVVTSTFLVMSGFLLAFNMELYAEKHRIGLWDWPKGMLMRWLRLTPTYALVMFTVMTLMRHLGDGPQWDMVVTSEADACNQYWWAHLLYINNYILDDTHCFPQSWYLAADTQLFGLGLLVCILFRKPRTQMMALAVMLAVSLAIPTAHIYFQNLGVDLQTPEGFRTLYKSDMNRILYVRGHVNVTTYTLGIAGGLLVYHWLKNEKSVSVRLQKYRWLVWLSLPMAIATILSGSIFYMDNYEPSTLMTALYATVFRPIFQFNMVFIIIGCIFKAENVFRGVLEWRGFTWTGRVSYAGFLLHTLFQRGLFGSQRLPTFMSPSTVMTHAVSTIVLAFGTGAMLFMTVESPIAVLTKTMLAPRKEQNTEDSKDTIKV